MSTHAICITALVLAWLMFNAALFLLLDRKQRERLSRTTIDRFTAALHFKPLPPRRTR